MAWWFVTVWVAGSNGRMVRRYSRGPMLLSERAAEIEFAETADAFFELDSRTLLWRWEPSRSEWRLIRSIG